MANTTLTQTGAEVQADLNKVEGLANIKTIGSGLSLSNAGELSTSGGGDILYCGDGANYYSIRGNVIYMMNITLINSTFNVNAAPSSALLLVEDNSGATQITKLSFGYYAREDGGAFAFDSAKLIVFSCGIVIMHVKLIPYVAS